MIAEEQEQRENTAFAEASNAFDSAGAYSWCGHALTWAERHNWLWISVIRRANYEPEQNALAMMCPFQPSEKQALLEAPTLADRANVMVALLEMSLAANDDSANLHRN